MNSNEIIPVVAEVISLAQAAGKETEAIRKSVMKKRGKDENFPFFDVDDMWEIYKQDKPHRDALRSYLDSLDVEVLRDLVAVMYVGRGDTKDIDFMRSHVAKWDKPGCVMKLMEKSPLPRYLRNGSKLVSEG